MRNLILDDCNPDEASDHIQSLCAQLDVLGIVQPDEFFEWWQPRTFLDDLQGPFKSWRDIPPVVCVTLVVPRRAIDMFSDLRKGNGSTLCHLQVQSATSEKRSDYTDIQTGFGQVRASGDVFTNQYNVTVTPQISRAGRVSRPWLSQLWCQLATLSTVVVRQLVCPSH